METTAPQLRGLRPSNPARARPLRVAAVPAAHPYVRAIGADARLLSDPQPPGAGPGRWWPPEMLRPDWIRANAGAFDLMHVHFGTEALAPGQLEAALDALAAAGKPLVHTVHDLEHPQLADPAGNDARLGLLVRRADALLTLTDAAADVIRARWGRDATVVGHPHVAELDAPLPAGAPARTRRVGVHLRDLRPNVDGPGTVAALAAAVRRTGGAVSGHAWLHDRVRDPAAAAAVRRACGADVELTTGPRPDDAALRTSLAGLDVAVLPYRHGTHSGWIELCWDLGVPVAAPALGCFAGQHDDPAALASFTPGDPASLTGALAQLLARGTRPGSAERRLLQAERRAQRRVDAARSAAIHDAVYAAVLNRCA